MQKVTKAGFIIWFICAFFYALEFIIRASGNSLYNDFSIEPYNLSPEQISVLSSVFYWAYVAFQLPAGILIDKFGVKRLC